MTSHKLWPFRGLAGQMLTILTLALLPIGAMAFLQATQIAKDASRRLEAALLTETAEAAAGEALAIASASGTVSALAAQIADEVSRSPDRKPDSQMCSTMFTNVVRANPQFSFAGFTDADGIVRCGSTDVGRDMSEALIHPVMVADPDQMVLASSRGQISNTSVIVTAAPVWIDRDYAGYVAVSVPHGRVRDLIASPAEDTLDHVITFNQSGAIISVDDGLGETDTAIPANHALEGLVTTTQFTFKDTTLTGDNRRFAVVPIIPSVLYALGSAPHVSLTWPLLSPLVFPALMLVAGLIAAYISVHSLVLRHIHALTRHMAAYTNDRTIHPLPSRVMMPAEIKKIDLVWTELAQTVMRDEADLENLLHEKNVLLKEVHHRVKNNLQLIASIVNLKIRRASTDEARRALKEVQMRVMSIASVHQSLYTQTNTGKVPANELLTAVIDGTIDAGASEHHRIEVTRRYDPVMIYPDQAVPFLLLASEAVTNALKYMGRLDDGTATLSVILNAKEGEDAELSVVNTRGTPFFPPDQVRGSGLGQSLIRGFAAQIDGRATIEETDDYYEFRLVFSPAPFDDREDLLSDDAFDGDDDGDDEKREG